MSAAKKAKINALYVALVKSNDNKYIYKIVFSSTVLQNQLQLPYYCICCYWYCDRLKMLKEKEICRSGCTQCIGVCLHAAAEAVLFLFFSATTGLHGNKWSHSHSAAATVVTDAVPYKLGFEHFSTCSVKK